MAFNTSQMMIFLVQLLIYAAIRAAPDIPEMKKCLDRFYENYKGTVQPTQRYIPELPECIITMQTKNQCPVGLFSGLFVCLNKHNDGADIQQPGATALLWSGSDGLREAKEVEKFQKEEYIEPKPVNLQDYSVKACDANLRSIKKAYGSNSDKPDKDKHFMFFGINFLWFIWNSNPEQHRNTIKQWTSLKAYETTAVEGESDLIAAKVTKALVVNNFFWVVEMASVAKLFKFKNLENTGKLLVHLRKYTEEGKAYHPKPKVDTKWAEYNIFGPLDSLKDVPVIYYDPFEGKYDGRLYPIFKDTSATTTCSLKDLIDAFNNEQGKEEDKITNPLSQINIRRLLQFLKWASEIPMHSTGPKIRTSASALSSPYNEFADDYDGYRKYDHEKRHKGHYSDHSDEYEYVNDNNEINTSIDYLMIIMVMFICCLFAGFIFGVCNGWIIAKYVEINSIKDEPHDRV